MPTLTCATTGIYGCGISGRFPYRIIKTRHCISGVVGSSLWDLLGLTHCHRLRDGDGGVGCLQEFQCSLSIEPKFKIEVRIYVVFEGWDFPSLSFCPQHVFVRKMTQDSA